MAALREKLAALEAEQELVEQRKQVTVLFADVAGFTTLSEHMDAEDVTSLVNALWQRLDAVIIAQGGRIDKHIGDAVLALWGADAAREDDPARATRAALEMQKEIGQTGSGRLTMRIGIHTGPVLLGDNTVGTVAGAMAAGGAAMR